MGTAFSYYGQWRSDWVQFETAYDNARAEHTAYNAVWVSDWASARHSLQHLGNAVIATLNGLNQAINWQLGTGRLGSLLYLLAQKYDEAPWENGEETELTWEDIVAAWINADQDGRMQTVLTLDELRREAWDKEFITYRIAPAGPT